MYFGLSFLLIAAGAILHWAVSDEVSGVDLSTVGIILMVIGGVAFLISLLYEFSHKHRREVVTEEPTHRVVESRRVDA